MVCLVLFCLVLSCLVLANGICFHLLKHDFQTRIFLYSISLNIVWHMVKKVDVGNCEEDGDSSKWVALLEQCESAFFLKNLGSARTNDEPDELSCAIALECLSQVGQAIPQYQTIISVITRTLKRSIYCRSHPLGQQMNDSEPRNDGLYIGPAYFKVVRDYQIRCQKLEEDLGRLKGIAAEAEEAKVQEEAKVPVQEVLAAWGIPTAVGHEAIDEERRLWEHFFTLVQSNDTPNSHKLAYIQALMSCTTLGERPVRSVVAFALNVGTPSP
jgi:hypothetical protein